MLGLRAQVGQQPRQRAVAVHVDVGGHRRDEGVQLPGAVVRGRRGGSDGELHLEAQRGDHPADEISDGLADVAPQRTQFKGAGLDAAQALVRVGALARALQRLGEGHDGRRLGLGERGGDLVGEVTPVGSGEPRQLRRAPAELTEVGRTQRPARTSQHPDHVRVGRHVTEHPEHGDDVGDLGHLEQPVQPDDLDGHAPGDQRRVEGPDRRVPPRQHRDVAPAGDERAVVGRHDAVRHPGDLAVLGVERRRRDLARWRPVRGDQVYVDAVPPQLRIAAQGRRQRVRRVQDDLARAPVHGQRIGERRLAVGAREAGRERDDVGRRRAAPPVDGLARIAHGRDRVPPPLLGRSAGEQGSQELRLGGRRVLVLVQQHDRELLAQRRRHVRYVARQAGSDGHLVCELDGAQVALQRLEVLDQARQLDPLGRPRRGVPQRREHLPSVVRGRRVRLGHERRRLRAHVVDLGQVGREVGVQTQDLLGHRVGLQPGQVPEGSGGRRHHPRRQPEPRRARDHARVRLDAHPQPVIVDQPRRERVVRHDQLLAGVVHPGRVHGARPLERRPHPGRELGSGLARERQPQHLLGPDLSRAHQPHHPGCHHRRLAGPRAGDHDPRFEGRRDRVQLLAAELDPQRVAKLAGEPQAPHVITCPDVAGQLDAKEHQRHALPGVASKRPDTST